MDSTNVTLDFFNGSTYGTQSVGDPCNLTSTDLDLTCNMMNVTMSVLGDEEFTLVFRRGDESGELEELEEARKLNNINLNIRTYYLYVLCFLGVPTNVMTIITILTMQAMSPATFYVATLAFCDGSALICKLIGNQFTIRQVRMDTVWCAAGCLPMYLSSLANWVLALICTERFVSVCYPLKKSYIFTKRRSYISIGVTSFVLLVPFLGVFAVMRDYTPVDKTCATKEEYLWFWENIYFWIEAILIVFFPFVVIFISTCAIVRGLRLSRKARRTILRNSIVKNPHRKHEMTNANNERLVAETERAERNITAMMVLAAVLFLILALPSCVYFFTARKIPDSESVSIAQWGLFKEISFVLMDSNHAINFFLYFYTAKRFRNQFFKLVKCRPLRSWYVRRTTATHLGSHPKGGSEGGNFLTSWHKSKNRKRREKFAHTI
ncbi:sex peptide receptor-related protein 2-like [Physella acuta]|uniref:sex peptide receptor-related protein 2-like n=1 Tax=Physella acuta TaxID=109671 RepID=UPI0027DB732F|nr:sex peptide receptor-related protein 2-like [Physella acuta]